MSTFSLLRFQLRILISSRRLRYAALVSLIGIVVVYLQELPRFWSYDYSELPCAAIGWMANSNNMHTYLWFLLTLYALPVLACILHGDVLFDDVKKHRLSAIISRSSRSTYILSSTLLVFLSAFFFILIFEIISQLVALLIFPFRTDPDTFQVGYLSSAAEVGTWRDYVRELPFGYFASIDLYLFNLAYMLYNAYYMASLALVSFALSLYLRKSRLLILVLPTALMLLASRLVPNCLDPASGLLISTIKVEHLTLFSILAVPTGCLMVCVAAIMLHEKVFKGDLL